MSNSRSFRRRLATGSHVPKTGHRFPDRPPALGTVRRWLNASVAEGMVERRVAERTGKPGRPPYEYGLTEAGKAHPVPGTFRDMLTELQAKRVHALVKKGMSERQAITAVTKGWRSDQYA